MDRRHFLKTATTGGALAAAGLLGQPRQARAQGEAQPNILFILIDEFRYPRVFPQGIKDAGEFLSQFMPQTNQLVWQKGVKFAGHYTAGVACSPARGTLVTGLYTQQSWLLLTILDSPTTRISAQPVLKRHYPTYGKLLRRAGYQVYRQIAPFDPARQPGPAARSLWFRRHDAARPDRQQHARNHRRRRPPYTAIPPTLAISTTPTSRPKGRTGSSSASQAIPPSA